MRCLLVLFLIVSVCSSCVRRGGSGSSRSSSRSTESVYNTNNEECRTPRGTTRKKSAGQSNAPRISNGKVLTAQEIFTKCNSAVFMIFTSSGFENFQGSGFFINSSGLAVSNYHVFEGTTIGYEVIKLQDGRQYKLKDVVLKDKANDIMVFTIDAGNTVFKYLPLSTRKPRVGDKAYAIGSPRGLENTFSSGEISQLREDNIIQISVPIDHGSSGGALINEYGEVIGITSAGLDYSGANLNFAISIDVVKNNLNR